MTSTEPSCGQNFCQKSLGHHVRCSLQSSSLRASVNGKKMKNSLFLELTETVKQSPQLSCQISKETMMLLQGFHELLKQLAINTGQLIHGTKHTHTQITCQTYRSTQPVGGESSSPSSPLPKPLLSSSCRAALAENVDVV